MKKLERDLLAMNLQFFADDEGVEGEGANETETAEQSNEAEVTETSSVGNPGETEEAAESFKEIKRGYSPSVNCHTDVLHLLPLFVRKASPVISVVYRFSALPILSAGPLAVPMPPASGQFCTS